MTHSISPFMRRVNGRDSGHAGRKAEESAAKRFRTTSQPGSGSLAGVKADFKATLGSVDFLMENKTTKSDSFAIKKSVLLKVYQEALETNRVPALTIQFVNDAGKSEKRERWVALPEAEFLRLLGD